MTKDDRAPMAQISIKSVIVARPLPGLDTEFEDLEKELSRDVVYGRWRRRHAGGFLLKCTIDMISWGHSFIGKRCGK
jgi:hypothetical protein